MPFMRILLLFCLLASPATSAYAGEFTLVASGDILLGGSAAPVLKQRGFDFPFAATRAILSDADLAVGNLEAPLTDSDDEFGDKRFRFKVPPAAAAALRDAGFDVLTLANNHLGDFGPQGVLDTVTTLRDAGLKSAGAGRNLAQAREPALVTVGDQTVALLAYSNTFPTEFYATATHPGTAPGYPSHVVADIRKARALADVVIVSFHWGGEALVEPKDYQQNLGRQAIDAGAQVVLGHHPHVLQGVEFYHGGVIYYSLGNFAFGSYSKTARTSALARVTLRDGEVAKAEVLPLSVYNLEVNFQPRPLEQEQADAFAEDFGRLCAPLGTVLQRQPDLFWGLAPGATSPP